MPATSAREVRPEPTKATTSPPRRGEDRQASMEALRYSAMPRTMLMLALATGLLLGTTLVARPGLGGYGAVVPTRLPAPVQVNVFLNVPEAAAPSLRKQPQNRAADDDNDDKAALPHPLGYPIEVFERGNRTVFAMETQRNGMLFVVALGKDGQLWHSFQEPPRGAWRDWAPLTSVCPNATDAARPCKFDADPNIGKNADGRLEVFARFEENLDLWQMHQTDANDPESWTAPREGSCVDQDQETSIWHCLEPGMPDNQSVSSYWIIDSPVFATSDVSVLRNDTSGKLQVYFRNFEGHLYMVEQLEAGSSDRYSMPRVIAPELTFI